MKLICGNVHRKYRSSAGIAAGAPARLAAAVALEAVLALLRLADAGSRILADVVIDHTSRPAVSQAAVLGTTRASIWT